MRFSTRFACVASALLLSSAACNPSSIEPIGEGGSSSSSSSASGSSSSAGTGGAGGSGACTPACQSGEICVESSCHALAQLDTATTATEGACNIVFDATDVFWKTSDLRRVAKSGGPSTLLDFTTTSPAGLVVDDTYVYWTTLGIERAEKTSPGKPGTSAGTFIADEGGLPTHMAGDGTTLYYIDGSSVFEVATAGNPDPQAPPTLFSSTWSDGTGPIAVDATSVYLWTEAASVLTKVAKDNQLSKNLANKANGKVDDNCGIVVDGDTVYYSTAPLPASGGIVASVPAAGGTSTILVDSTVGANGVFAVDDTSVYFMTPAAVMKVPKAGGTPVLVRAIEQPSPFPTCIAADDQYVYWVEGLALMQYRK